MFKIESEGNDNSLQYSSMENHVDRRDLGVGGTVHGVAKSQE